VGVTQLLGWVRRAVRRDPDPIDAPRDDPPGRAYDAVTRAMGPNTPTDIDRDFRPPPDY
jgi:hypothetical protein